MPSMIHHGAVTRPRCRAANRSWSSVAAEPKGELAVREHRRAVRVPGRVGACPKAWRRG